MIFTQAITEKQKRKRNESEELRGTYQTGSVCWSDLSSLQ